MKRKKITLWWASGMLLFGMLLLLESIGIPFSGKASFRGFPMDPIQSFLVGGLFTIGGISIFIDYWRSSKAEAKAKVDEQNSGNQ